MPSNIQGFNLLTDTELKTLGRSLVLLEGASTLRKNVAAYQIGRFALWMMQSGKSMSQTRSAIWQRVTDATGLQKTAVYDRV